MRRIATALGLSALATLALQSGSTAAPGDPSGLSASQRTAMKAGVQVAPKAATGAKAARRGLNPYLANLADPRQADYAGWQQRMTAAAKARISSDRYRAARAKAFGTGRAAALPPAVVYDEQEPAGNAGSNDTRANAEPVNVFGTASTKSPRVRILGDLADLAPARRTITTREDQGSIPLATATGIAGTGAVRVSSVLGDGPHGPSGDDSNDFDFYKLDVAAGRTINASTVGSPSGTDTVIGVYNAAGELLAADDDGGEGLSSNLVYKPPAAGTYYVIVAGYADEGPFPEDPSDSGSGTGGADTGNYVLAISSQLFDTDVFALRLRPGDVIGSTGKGSAVSLKIATPTGRARIGSDFENGAASIYPPESPLPSGGNSTISYVAEEAGWYTLAVSGAVGAYDVLVEGYRPGAQTDPSSTRQTVLLDFDPGRVNTAIWGGLGNRDVSPFSTFVPRWGIPRAQASTLESRILSQVRANVQTENAGTNPTVKVTVLNARDHQNLIGKENVSRIYIAGTIEQTGLETIGIAQYIDPGNYGHEDQAIVLLDLLSEAAGEDYSLNTYMRPRSDRVKFVSQAVANVTAHEIGHTLGNFHTDNENPTHNTMDAGGINFGTNLYGVGPDLLGGTADDENIQFRTDTYDLFEGFSGLENTENVVSWAYSGR